MAVWAKSGVEETCLELQDRHDQCVALLLWRLWASAEDRPVNEATLARAIKGAKPFDHDVLRPLRAARRAVESGDLHAKIRAAELAAEHDLLDRLDEETPPAGGSAPLSGAAALADLMRAWNGAGAEATAQGARLAAVLSLC